MRPADPGSPSQLFLPGREFFPPVRQNSRGLLSKEFAAAVLIANVLAWPAAYFIMRGWLQQFAYRTNIAWWLFPAAGTGALLIAMITVSFQALRAAQTDPVKALKYE